MGTSEELEARTPDGVVLRLDRVKPSGARTGVVVCLHAMMTDGRYFGARRPSGDGFAHALAAVGLDVFVADFRGHGGSVPPVAGKHDWSFDDLVEHDLPTILTTVAITAQVATGDIAILGHSLGGLVTCAALGTGRIAAPRSLVLAATSVWLGDSTRRRAIMTAYAGVTALFGRAPIRALRAGTADESATYVKQLTGWSKHGRWTSLAGVDYMVALETINAPTFAFTGATDWMCKPDDAAAISKRIRTCEPLRVVGKVQGDKLDPDHFQLFTRPELTTLRREVAERLVRA